MTYNGLPVFNIKLNEDDETQGMSVVSIVDDPAVCQSLFCFSKEEKKPMMFVDEQNTASPALQFWPTHLFTGLTKAATAIMWCLKNRL